MVVQPIRDSKKIEAMKKYLLAGPYGRRNHLLFVMGINSGLRISDMLKLKFSDVANADGKVHSHIVLHEQKTGKHKRFGVSKNLAKAITAYIESLGSFNLDDFVFKSRKGTKAITRVQAWEILKNAARAVGIEDEIGTHTLRKTFGYHARKQGCDIAIIQEIFNHASPADTKRYIGITQDELDEVYVGLNL